MNADGSGAKPLTKLTASQMDCRSPAWSADGTKIAYYSERALDGSDTMSSNPYNIWVINADGSKDSPLTQLTAYAADSLYPQWSPDGTKLAFNSSRALDGSNAANGSEPYTQNVWVMKSDGTSALPITSQTNFSVIRATFVAVAALNIIELAGSLGGMTMVTIAGCNRFDMSQRLRIQFRLRKRD
jgi:Tol biopolymer transport system component